MDDSPEPDHRPEGRRTTWRVATPLVVLLSGTLFAVSAADSDGTDLRPGRYGDLASVVRSEADAYEQLQSRVDELSADVEELTGSVDDEEVTGIRQQAEALRDPAGLTPRTGPGVRVVLSDSPEDVLDRAIADGDIQIDWLVVHQQDLQAVVNAMWDGGADAVTIAGQRVVSTTGIKCEGNAVQLQGVPYPQPYVIEAVGDPEDIIGALELDQRVTDYRADAADPDIAIGWDVEVEDVVEAPAFAGLLDISYAEPIG